MRKTLIISTIFIAVLALSGKAAHAHHNANYPESANPAFVGIDLYSYHNDAIEYSLSMQDGNNNQEITQNGTVTSTANQTATVAASQAGSTTRTSGRR